MTRRALALLTATCAVVTFPFVSDPGPAGASSHTPLVQTSTTVLVPGHTLVITGSGWPRNAGVSAMICGAEAISGSVDCAVTSAAALAASSSGHLWGKIVVALPPAPCPCVVLVTGTTLSYTKSIPVTVVGAATVPVRRATPEAPPELRISDIQVVGGPTLVSLFGGPAHRTLDFRVRNLWDQAVTPILLGRWGNGKDLQNVIVMPRMKALGPGQSREITVPFSLTALSLGSYAVAVRVQLLGYPGEFGAATSTSQWPVGLFVCGILLVLLLAYLVMAALRRRKKKTREATRTEPGVPTTQAQPQEDLTPA